MTRSLIIGSGPAAAGVALALARDEQQHIRVLDIGTRLEADRQQTVARLASGSLATWSPDDVRTVSLQPVDVTVKGLPEKRSFGSDYAFRNVGQRDDIDGGELVNTAVVSSAFGGFSNVWGSQIMPFTAETLSQWPVSSADLEPHYRAILRHVPLAGAEDDMESMFPLYAVPTALPELANRSRAVLGRYGRHRRTLNDLGVTMGEARLALRSAGCPRCGLCMTGCPYRLIYSAADTFDQLTASGRVEYLPGMLAIRVDDDPTGASVQARDMATGEMHRFEADRVYLACGAIGTTRLVLNSLRRFGEVVRMGEAAQFVLPALSARPVSDPRDDDSFTLNQYNMAIQTASPRDTAFIHFYAYNPAMSEALPAILRHPRAEALHARTLRHLTVGLGYLPSWAAPPIEVRASAPRSEAELPPLQLGGVPVRGLHNPMFRAVARTLVKSARGLDLWPLLPMTQFAAPGKSYHWGGSFPMTAGHRTRYSTDVLGRPEGWRHVHMVDASVFPDVPATTFTLSIMANAHRIASEAMAL